MLIEFAPEILNSENNYDKFIFLLKLFYVNRRYDFFIDVSEIIESPLYTLLNSSDKEVINEYFQRQVGENKKIDFVIDDRSHNELYFLTLDEGIAYFNQPLYIVLENSNNDKHFLEAIVKNFTKKGKKIKRHIEERWISYLNAGGCTNIEGVISEKISTFNNLPKPANFYLRVFVLVDSDSEYPEDIKASRAELKSFLEKNNIKYHFLIKREMENYLPEEVIEGIPNNAEYIGSYKRLTPLQKDYLDIEKGFLNKNFENYDEGIKLLFESVSEADRVILRKERLIIPNFKAEFPKLFNNELVTQSTLQKRVAHQGDNVNELANILDKINELL